MYQTVLRGFNLLIKTTKTDLIHRQEAVYKMNSADLLRKTLQRKQR